MKNYGRRIAKAGLEIKAIKLNPENPFTWASGYRMPIYNDNRMFLFYPHYRNLIRNGFYELILKDGIAGHIIAGTATAGIPYAVLLADKLHERPFIYVRDQPKDHGLKNQIEGIDAEKDLDSMYVVLIEDLISTGGSSAKAVQASWNANGKCNHCLSIFNYGLEQAAKEFSSLDPKCEVRSLLTYDILLEVAKKTGYLTEEQIKLLEEWRADPYNWGERHGFSKVEKK